MKNPFLTEEIFEQIYSDCLENQPPMTLEQRQKMEKLNNETHNVFAAYVTYLQEESFRYGYECGYNAALKEGAVDE